MEYRFSSSQIQNPYHGPIKRASDIKKKPGTNTRFFLSPRESTHARDNEKRGAHFICYSIYDALIVFRLILSRKFKGLYDGLGVRDVKQLKGLKKKQSLLDHMDTEELAANMFRATQTEAKLKRDNVKGKQLAYKTHHDVGKKVRDTIKSFGGTMPEDLEPEEDIKKLERRKKKEIANKERKKLDN